MTSWFYRHECERDGRLIRQNVEYQEPIPSVGCRLCGERFTVAEMVVKRVWFSKTGDPDVWS